jgi:hypothetical protein
VLSRYSKEERLSMGTGQLETGKFLLPAKAEFLEAFRKELLGFPDVKHNDQVDALSQFLAELRLMGGRFEAPRDESGKPLRPMRKPRRPRRYEPDSEPDDDGDDA